MKMILRSLAVLFAADLLAFALAEDPIVGVMVGLGCFVLLIVAAFLRVALRSNISDDDAALAAVISSIG